MACPGAQLKIITTELPLAYQNQLYNATIYAEGGVKPLNWSISTGPSWLTCTPSSDTTAYVCSGTPPCPGSYTLTVNVEDSPSTGSPSTASRTYTINVQPDPLKLTPVPGTTWYTYNGSGFSTTINATGGRPTYSFNCNSSSCYGLSCTSNTISGTASITGNSSVTCSFNFAVTDYCNQTASGTYYVVINPTYAGGGGGGGGGGSPPTCNISVVPKPILNNTRATVNWSISNGPAAYNFYPNSGNCTSGIGSTGGICITGIIISNFHLNSYVYNAYGENICYDKVCVEVLGRKYRVWSMIGFHRDYRLPDGTCVYVRNGYEITRPGKELTSGTRITIYNSNNTTCSGGIRGTYSYPTAICNDYDGDSQVWLQGNETGADK